MEEFITLNAWPNEVYSSCLLERSTFVNTICNTLKHNGEKVTLHITAMCGTYLIGDKGFVECVHHGGVVIVNASSGVY